MITPRGWWLMVIVSILLLVSIWGHTPSVTLVSLTLLTWILVSLFTFAIRVRQLSGKLSVLRQLYDDQGPVHSLWADRTYRVRLQVRSRGSFPSPYIRITDRVPYGAKCISGEIHMDGSVFYSHPLEINYYLHCLAAGQIRFEGVQIQISDLQGLFYHSFFVRSAQTLRVMPAFADIKGHVPTTKRLNVLPLMGTHRFRKPGSGSELLDLRDYISGDPPKTIAWKVSARRDRLITKVFESEVPIRCTFFVDTSDSVRVGMMGQNALARLVELTASLCQATAGNRDLPGLCLFDDVQVRKIVRPARGSRHVVNMLNVLADVSSLPPASKEVDPEQMLPLAYGFAEEVYPDLLTQEVNHFPWWLPVWAPQKNYRKRNGSLLGRFTLWIAAAFIFVVITEIWFTRNDFQRLVLFILAFLGFGMLTQFWLVAWEILKGTAKSQRYRWRKKLAAIFSVRHGLAPQGLGEMLEEDGLFVKHLQRFLAEHHVPYALPLYNDAGQYLFASPGKVDILAKALLRSIAQGKDNELFVLMVDLLELDNLDPLVRAVKVGIARHHQIILVCPWPPGILVPQKEDEETRRNKKMDWGQLITGQGLRNFLKEQTTRRLHRAYFKLRKTFGRLGVMVQCVAEDDTARLILDRLKFLRNQGRGVR